MQSRLLKRSLIALLVTQSVALATVQPAAAALISTESALTLEQRQSRLAPLQQALARADVQAKLIEKGVDPQAAAARIANLSDAEIASIQQQIDQLPAGGDGLFAVLGIVFIVLLILDFVGATNVFRSV
ncbi:MAG: PA2779 family protein [Pseudomonadales bacterium]|jgi:hypothetical protein|nr:PA2779 family protein [Pseudomonadales bacterium]MCC6530233.1 PA2779 family protein [Pseudomonadales bacterium]MCP5332934.1 PA2779 family protein [Pseudomonadales bacterium]HMU89509.1 PA2779 family protein [Pseudomonadales bacterium]HMW14737.1 PA2779 family protein [Pseudomonadales bacterium]